MIIFSFALKPDTKEAVFSGNITARQAIGVLQDIVIADEVRRSKESQEPKKEATVENKEPVKVVDELNDNLLG